MNVTTVSNNLSVNCGVVPVGWGVQVNQWSPTDQPTFAVLAKDCGSPAYTGLLGAVNAMPVIGVASRVVADDGAKLLDMRFIDSSGADIGGFDVRYENGQIIYPWITQIPDVPVVDLSDILNRLDIIEDTCCDSLPDVSEFITVDALAPYATKDYVTTVISNNSAAVTLMQDVPDNAVVETYTRSSGYLDGGVLLTNRSSIVGISSPSTNNWGAGLTVIKTKNVDGSAFNIVDPLAKTGAIFAYRDETVNTLFSPIVTTLSIAGVIGYAPKSATYAYGVRGFLKEADNLTITSGSEGILGFKEKSGKLWAGAFFGDVYIGGNAVLAGTATGWPDYVFADNYVLQPFNERMISQRVAKHLTDMPSMEDIATEGIPVQTVLIGLVKHIEELYLYLEELRNGK